jgi:hypothetical protein
MATPEPWPDVAGRVHRHRRGVGPQLRHRRMRAGLSDRGGPRWTDTGRPTLPYVSVNVSVRQFRWPGFIRRVHELLAEAGLPPDRLTLEITESLLLRVDDDTWEDLKRIGGLGCPQRYRRLRSRLLGAGLPPAGPPRHREAGPPSSAPWRPPAANGISSGASSRPPDARTGRRGRRHRHDAAARHLRRHRLRLRAGLPVRAFDVRIGSGRPAGARAHIRVAWHPPPSQSGPECLRWQGGTGPGRIGTRTDRDQSPVGNGPLALSAAAGLR